MPLTTSDVNANPWVINAVDVTGLIAVSGNGNNPGDIINIGGTFYLVVWRGAVHVYQVELQKYIADTDTGALVRYSTKPFCDINGAADLSPVRSGNAGWTTDGLLVPNNGITNGSLRIFHK